MDAIVEFFSSENFKYLFPIVIGIIFSWYISKHFFFKKKPSIIQRAKRLKTADFGDYRNVVKEVDSIVINTLFFGDWKLDANGTVTDTKNNLTWIRAPWGTTWDGINFVGSPILVKWREASDLFGKGIFIKSPFPTITMKQRPTNFKENYTKGSCTVNFAGHDDWRLPTSSEIDTLQFYFPLDLEIEIYKKHEIERNNLRKKLFPYLIAFTEADVLKYKLWSADIADVHCAWSHHGNTSLDDTKIDKLCNVLFVRKN